MTNYGTSKVSYAWNDRLKWLDTPFPLEEYEGRWARLRRAMVDNGVDAIVAYGCPSDQGHVRWLANFPSFYGNTFFVLASQGEPVLCTDSVMHSEPMHAEIWASPVKDVRWSQHPATVRTPGNVVDHVRDALREAGAIGGTVGLVGMRAIPHRFYVDLEDRLGKTKLRDLSSVFMDLKSVRSPREIGVLRRVARQASRGLDAALDLAREGLTENDLAAATAKAMFEDGMHELAFPPAVVSGPRAGLKHCYPTARKLSRGDLVFIDVGAGYHGYLSDVCRTFVLGEPDAEKRKMQETALRMEQSVIDDARPGARICDLQSTCERIAREAGFEEYYFPTGFGHGIGTTITEIPVLFPDNEAALKAGMTFAVEPMLVKLGVGSAVFEDVLLVTETGCESLSDARKVIAKT